MRFMARNVLDHHHVQILQQNYLDSTGFLKETYSAKYDSAQDKHQIVGNGPSVFQLNPPIQDSILLTEVLVKESPSILAQNVYHREGENDNS